MILTLDIGNSHHSFALHGEKSYFCDEKEITKHQASITQVIYSSVASDDRTTEILKNLNFPKINSIRDYKKNNKLYPFKINYTETLGDDRLALAYYCSQKFDASLAVDMGTFTTIDLVTKNEFVGGYILPGEKIYFDSYQKGNFLKNITFSTSLNHQGLPHSTEEAIGWSYLACLTGVIDNLSSNSAIKTLVLTGGSHRYYFSEITKKFPKLKVISEPLAIHLGLAALSAK